MEIISKLFTPSPFCHLRDHASETGACLRRLQCHVEAALSDDREGADGHLKEIQSRVLVGREIADELYQLLSRRVMLAVRREDILSTIEAQNLMLCACGELASLISARSLPLDDDTRQQLRTYVREVLEFSILAIGIIANVNVLVEVCFEGPEADKVGLLIDDIQLRMAKTDLLRSRLVSTLFSHERHVCPPVHSFCLCLLSRNAEHCQSRRQADQPLSSFLPTSRIASPRRASRHDGRLHLGKAIGIRVVLFRLCSSHLTWRGLRPPTDVGQVFSLSGQDGILSYEMIASRPTDSRLVIEPDSRTALGKRPESSSRPQRGAAQYPHPENLPAPNGSYNGGPLHRIPPRY